MAYRDYGDCARFTCIDSFNAVVYAVKGGVYIEKLEKLGVLAIVILLLTAGAVVCLSWQQTQNANEPCTVTILNITSNATTAKATAKAQVNQIAQVNQTQKKTLVFLYMTNCHYCEQMKPIIDDLIVKSYSGNFEVIHVNIDTTPGAAVQYGVVSTPTMVILQNGKEINRFVGVVDENTLLNALK